MNESTIIIILSVVEIIISIALIVVILMQSKNASGLSGALGGMGQSNTYWDKNKGRSLEGKLTKYTKIFAALFIVLALLISFLPSVDTSQSDEISIGVEGDDTLDTGDGTALDIGDNSINLEVNPDGSSNINTDGDLDIQVVPEEGGVDLDADDADNLQE